MSNLPDRGQWRTKFLDLLAWPLGMIFFVVLTVDFYVAIGILVDIFSRTPTDYKNAISALGPPTIGLGVFVAWISFLSNQRHKQDEVDRETSAFFYDECTRKLEKVVSTLSSTISSESWMHNINSNLDDSDWKNVLSDLSDVLVMWRHISHGTYKQAFSVRWKDIQNLILQKLRTLTLYDYIRLHWGGNLQTIEERIEGYNQTLTEGLRRPDEARHFEALSKAKPRDEFTPFPNGLSSVSLKKIICIVAPPIDKAGTEDEAIVNSYIADKELDVLKQYFGACSSYRFDNGLILRIDR